MTESEKEQLQNFFQEFDALEARKPDISDVKAYEAWVEDSAKLFPKYDAILTKALESVSKDGDESPFSAIIRQRTPEYQHMPRGEKSKYPVDKGNGLMWHNKNPNVRYLVNVGSEKNEVNNEYIITQPLTESHFAVYTTIYNLYDRGYNTMTISQICREMRNSSVTPNDIDRTSGLVMDMLSTQVYIDDRAEAKAKNHKRSFSEYHQLLQGTLRNERATFNGQMVESYLYVTGMVMIERADFINQITAFPTAMLRERPVRISELTLICEKYIYSKVAHGKRGKKTSTKFTWNKFYEYAELESADAKTKARARKYIKIYMEHVKKYDLISSYTIGGVSKDALVTIYFKRGKKRIEGT